MHAWNETTWHFELSLPCLTANVSEWRVRNGPRAARYALGRAEWFLIHDSKRYWSFIKIQFGSHNVIFVERPPTSHAITNSIDAHTAHHAHECCNRISQLLKLLTTAHIAVHRKRANRLTIPILHTVHNKSTFAFKCRLLTWHILSTSQAQCRLSCLGLFVDNNNNNWIKYRFTRR